MSEQKQTLEFLRKVPLFYSLNDRQLKQLEMRMVRRSYAAGQSMVTQGDGGEGFFLILSGEAEVFRETLEGGWLLVNTFGAADYFGELTLLDDGPRTASVIASEPTECLVLARWDFLAVLHEGGVEMTIALLQELACRFRRSLDAL